VSHRYPFPGHECSYNNLHPVGAVVFGTPVLCQPLRAISREVGGGGVPKNQIKLQVERILRLLKQLQFDGFL
jgi:hypothetical protein